MRLLPCPFCGSKPEYTCNEHWNDGDCKDHCWDIKCTNKNCYLGYGAVWYCTKDKIAKMWNERKCLQTTLQPLDIEEYYPVEEED